MRYLAIILVAITMMSCQVTKPAVVVTTTDHSNTDSGQYHQSDKQQKDSIIVRDSIVVIVKNDTTYIERWHERYKDRVVVQTKTDSIYCYSVDSIYVEKPIYIERELTWWEKTRRSIGLSVVWTLIIVASFLALRASK